jgi:hypothetical protein
VLQAYISNYGTGSAHELMLQSYTCHAVQQHQLVRHILCLHILLSTGKIKRGLQRLISLGKSKSGKGVRVLRPGGGSSRKVRFNEDQHSSKSAAGQQQPGPAGTAAAGVGALKGSSINKKTAAAPGALKPGLRFADQTAAVATSGAAAGSKDFGLQAANAGSSQSSGEHPLGAPNTSNSNGSKPSLSFQLQQPSSSSAGSSGCPASSIYTSSSRPTHASGSGARGSSGDGSTASMMAVYLQQQPPQTPSFAAGSTSGNWEGLSRTDLAGGQSSFAVNACQIMPCLPWCAAACCRSQVLVQVPFMKLVHQ